MYSRIEVGDRWRKGPICSCLNRSGSIEVLKDIYIAAGFGGGRSLNVAPCSVSLNAEGRSNESMGIDGGRQSKEEYGSNERL
jgi:hypothetical protein